MSSTLRLQRIAVAIGGVFLVAGVAAAAQGSPAPPPAPVRPPDFNADLAAGRAHKLPEGPANWTYGSVWRNCQFVIFKEHSTHYTDGDVEVAVADSSPADVAAQLPPEDPACAGTSPTEAQIEENRARMWDLSESVRPKSAHPGPEGGNPGPPPTLPLHG